ncbi:dTDP-4-dehydrorhamnose reductase [Vibrio japonicus]|uniref:dTDP-4-dehydrorhamnose reductase n=1 Tax=Vibrio japonicus TaxID=1824638 RepID=A0ABY5LGF1_9VIBR|nr:dTDP-4-dehydrorhamnose reductase [Vibrio japonicus]UUM30030.1 dTDP-4-dehydrorhamnose reductase [Vibrio japonicus]
MKVLITGQGGQLAWELEQSAPCDVEFIALSSQSLDITQKTRVFDAVNTHQPDIVINAAAYTAVDKAETEPEIAYAVNEQGSEHLALACKELQIPLIHISTDFVFDGEKTTPYQIDDMPNPLNVYGDSKLKGDIKVGNVLGSDATIIRTAWVYSAHGNNFVKTMLRLMQEKDKLGIVYDQVGSPTWAKGLAEVIWQLAKQKCSQKQLKDQNNTSPQILHWTDAGVASWYDFAVAIQELALEKGLLSQSIPIRPIPASAYPTPAKRPSFSVIDKFAAEQASGIEATHWRKQLSQMMDRLV